MEQPDHIHSIRFRVQHKGKSNAVQHPASNFCLLLHAGIFFPTFSSHVVPFRQFFLGLVEGDVLLPLNLEN